jgi:hypothetical protein
MYRQWSPPSPLLAGTVTGSIQTWKRKRKTDIHVVVKINGNTVTKRKGKIFLWGFQIEKVCLIMHCVFSQRYSQCKCWHQSLFLSQTKYVQTVNNPAPFLAGAMTGSIKVQEFGIVPVPQR